MIISRSECLSKYHIISPFPNQRARSLTDVVHGLERTQAGRPHVQPLEPRGELQQLPQLLGAQSRPVSRVGVVAPDVDLPSAGEQATHHRLPAARHGQCCQLVSERQQRQHQLQQLGGQPVHVARTGRPPGPPPPSRRSRSRRCWVSWPRPGRLCADRARSDPHIAGSDRLQRPEDGDRPSSGSGTTAVR